MNAKREDPGHLLWIEVDYAAMKVSVTMVQSPCGHYRGLLNSAAKLGKGVVSGELDILTQADRDLLENFLGAAGTGQCSAYARHYRAACPREKKENRLLV